MRIFIAAGGTGGHIIPAIAVADAIKAKLASRQISRTEKSGTEITRKEITGREINRGEIIFIGSGTPLESQLIKQTSYELLTIPFVPFSGKGASGLLRLLLALPIALLKGLRLFCKRKPDVVIGFGGYPSFIPLACAFLCRTPRILHEQNVQVGIANKVLSHFVSEIYAIRGAKGFPQKRKVKFIGSVVKEAFYQIPDWKGPGSEEAYRVLVFGGSQGAVSLNKAFLANIKQLKSINIEIFHQTGRLDFERCSEIYRNENFKAVSVTPFIDDMVSAISQAHLIICRAGAMTVGEISAAGRPAIFVPLPIAGEHQAQNAAPLVEAGGARMLYQDDKLADLLMENFSTLFNSPHLLKEMAKQARNFAAQDFIHPADQLAEAAISFLSY